MKVAKQAQGDLLRGADAGRNGYERGMYDAFLACVQASARGVKLPPFMVGERLKVGGPMQVWKCTVGAVHLPLADYVHRLDPGQDSAGSPKCLNPIMSLTRRLMARWSYSTILFRYLDWRSTVKFRSTSTIQAFYAQFRVSCDLLELRNLVQVAELIVRCAQQRHESRGLHFNRDWPNLLPQAHPTVLKPLP